MTFSSAVDVVVVQLRNLLAFMENVSKKSVTFAAMDGFCHLYTLFPKSYNCEYVYEIVTFPSEVDLM